MPFGPCMPAACAHPQKRPYEIQGPIQEHCMCACPCQKSTSRLPKGMVGPVGAHAMPIQSMHASCVCSPSKCTYEIQRPIQEHCMCASPCQHSTCRLPKGLEGPVGAHAMPFSPCMPAACAHPQKAPMRFKDPSRSTACVQVRASTLHAGCP